MGATTARSRCESARSTAVSPASCTSMHSSRSPTPTPRSRTTSSARADQRVQPLPRQGFRDRVSRFVRTQLSTDSTFPTRWDPAHASLQLWTSYGLSSFTFCFVGIFMLVVSPRNFELEPKIPVPQELQALGLCAQSIATLFADVLFLSKDCLWHLVDRWLAMVNVAFIASNMYWLPSIEKAAFLTVVLGGAELLNRSRWSRVHRDETCFAFWHTAWHIAYPALLLTWLAYRQAACHAN